MSNAKSKVVLRFTLGDQQNKDFELILKRLAGSSDAFEAVIGLDGVGLGQTSTLTGGLNGLALPAVWADEELVKLDEYHLGGTSSITAVSMAIDDGSPEQQTINAGAPLGLVWPAVVDKAASEFGSSASAKPAASAPPKPKSKPKTKTYTKPDGSPYIARLMAKTGDYDVEAIRKSVRAGFHIMIDGPPGCGKTALTQAAIGPGMHTVLVNEGTEASKFMGSGYLKPDGSLGYHLGPLPLATGHIHDDNCPDPCGRATLYADEVNSGRHNELTILNEVTDGRTEYYSEEHGVLPISPDFRMIITINPDVPGSYLLPSFQSRFTLQFSMETDYNVAKVLKVDSTVVKWAKTLQSKKANGTPMGPLPNMRDLIGWQRVNDVFGPETAWSNLMSKAGPMNIAIWQDVQGRLPGAPDVASPLALLATD